jgi:hypothetical protein
VRGAILRRLPLGLAARSPLARLPEVDHICHPALLG